jgi:hypothetical protein
MKKHWQDWMNLLLGAWVFISPWAVQHVMASAATPGGAGGAGMWNLSIVGAAIAVLALVALYVFNAWEEWVNGALGLWLLVSPWLMGFSASAALTWNAVIAGILVAVFASWALYEEQQPKQVTR